MTICEEHQKPYEWIPLSPSRKVFRCPLCHAGVKATTHKQRVELPLIKFAQSFWRDRPYTKFEKSTPGGIAPKPKF